MKRERSVDDGKQVMVEIEQRVLRASVSGKQTETSEAVWVLYLIVLLIVVVDRVLEVLI